MTDAPRRGYGLASLLLSLAPLAALFVTLLVSQIAAAVSPNVWTGLAVQAFGVIGSGGLAIVGGIVAIALGIVAVRKRSGRGFGIAGITISAAFILLLTPALAFLLQPR